MAKIRKPENWSDLLDLVQEVKHTPQLFIELLQNWLRLTEHLQRSGRPIVCHGFYLPPGFSIGVYDRETRKRYPTDAPTACTDQVYQRLACNDDTRIGFWPLTILPRASMCCRSCGERFDIREMADIHASRSDEMLDISSRVGQKLRKLFETKRKDKRRFWRFKWGPNHKLQIMRLTGDLEKPYAPIEVGYDYVVQTGDYMEFERIDYRHPVCWARHLEAETREQFFECLVKAGFEPASEFIMCITKNEYGSESWRGPWFEVDLRGGPAFTIGWRKRVIELNYAKSGYVGKLTGDDETTSTQEYCHAWGYEKLVEYLSRLRKELEQAAVLV